MSRIRFIRQRYGGSFVRAEPLDRNGATADRPIDLCLQIILPGPGWAMEQYSRRCVFCQKNKKTRLSLMLKKSLPHESGR
jgi:hypothetical protein